MVIRSGSLPDEMQEIPISQVVVDPQVRTEFELASLQELAASLQELGQQSPILVRAEEEVFRLIYGERRLRAAKLIGWTKIRAIITHVDLTPSEILLRQLTENLLRADLCPLEIAKGMQQLIALDGLKASDVASRLGISGGSVTKHLGLLKLNDELQAKVARGELPVTSAYELSRVDSDEDRDQLARELLAGKLNRDGLARAIKVRTREAKEPKSAKAPLTSRATASLPGGRTVTITGSSLDLESFITVLEEILGKARKVRSQDVGLSTFLQMLRDQAMQMS